jgi:hypothetical protein
MNRMPRIMFHVMTATATALLAIGLLAIPNTLFAEPEPEPPGTVCKDCKTGGANTCGDHQAPCGTAARICESEKDKSGCNNCTCEQKKNSNDCQCIKTL